VLCRRPRESSHAHAGTPRRRTPSDEQSHIARRERTTECTPCQGLGLRPEKGRRRCRKAAHRCCRPTGSAGFLASTAASLPAAHRAAAGSNTTEPSASI
jgi:hypothetical protein